MASRPVRPFPLNPIPLPSMAAAAVGLAATVNLTAGAVMAWRDPSRASDLLTLYGWCRAWALAGAALYPDPNGSTDYPPNAIVVLSPLSILSWPIYFVTCLLIGLVATLLLPLLVARCTGRRSVIVWSTLLFLSWASARTLLQLSTPMMALMFAAVSLVERKPVASGLLLGLALAKPQFAAPVAVWMLLASHVRALVIAALVVVAGWIAFDAHAHVGLWTLLTSYWNVLVSLYSGNEGFIGRTSVRAWTLALAGGSRWGDVLWLTAAAVLVIVPCRVAVVESRTGGSSLAALSLFCLWSLLVFYHDSSHLTMMLPAFVFLLAAEDSPSLRQRWSFLVFLQIFLMYDVPNRLGARHLNNPALTAFTLNFDRLLVMATFVYVAIVWRRLNRGVPVGQTERVASPA